MTTFLIVTYSIGFLASWITIQGWTFAFFQGYFPTIAKKHKKFDAIFSIFWGAIPSLIWPIGLPMVYALTLGARYGWKRPKLRQI